MFCTKAQKARTSVLHQGEKRQGGKQLHEKRLKGVFPYLIYSARPGGPYTCKGMSAFSKPLSLAQLSVHSIPASTATLSCCAKVRSHDSVHHQQHKVFSYSTAATQPDVAATKQHLRPSPLLNMAVLCSVTTVHDGIISELISQLQRLSRSLHW